MARVAAHLRVSELERHTRAAKETTAARHYQAIWLLAKGHTVLEVAGMTSFGRGGWSSCCRATTPGARRRWATSAGTTGDADDPEAGAAGVVETAPGDAAARWWVVDGTQGGGLDGRRTRAGEGGAAARLGGAPGDRLDPSGAAPTASASGDGGGAGGV